MLKLWGRQSSFNVQKVLWFLNELGLQYETIPAGGKYGGLDKPEFLAMNPHGRVPVLDDHGTILWESHTILRYLAARYSKTRFWFEDPARRSLTDRWLDWEQTTLQPDFMAVFWGFYRTPESKRDWPTIHKRAQDCAEHFTKLDQQLKTHPYLLGEELTLADIPSGTALYRYYEMGIDYPSLPHVEAWYQRLQERPAYKKGVMMPFDELKGRLEF